MKKSIVTLIIILGLVAALGCTEKPEYSESVNITDENVPGQSGPVLEILEHHTELGEFGNLYIKGTAKNTGIKSLSYAEIRVKFYDANDTLLESSLDNINDLGPEETWSFGVIYPGLDSEKVATYKIAVGNIF